MGARGLFSSWVLGAIALTAASLQADPGDVESSRDYPGFARLPGFVITDFDEDNPAEFDFPVAQPLPDDADHVTTVHVRGHRYAIRYELGAGQVAPTLFQTQQYYEKLAADAGFKTEKNGAIGDVTETFSRTTGPQQVWVYLEPAVTFNVLTIVESTVGPTPPAPPRLSVTATPPHATAPIPAAPPLLPAPAIVPQTNITISAAPPKPEANVAAASTATVSLLDSIAPPEPEPAPAPIDPNDDSLFSSLSASGRVIVPFTFQPNKGLLDASSQSEIDRVAAMMSRHPELCLRIEGHTDNTGNSESNLRLSAQRALAVQAKLIDANIDRQRLDYVGVGGLQPLASNSTAEGRKRNRRIELVIWKKSPAFHSPAPNGQNYYPGTSASSTPPAGL